MLIVITLSVAMLNVVAPQKIEAKEEEKLKHSGLDSQNILRNSYARYSGTGVASQGDQCPVL